MARIPDSEVLERNNKEIEETRERVLKRRKDKKRANKQLQGTIRHHEAPEKSNLKPLFPRKAYSEKLNLSLQQLLDRLCFESLRGSVSDVDFFEKESVQRRKAELQNIKDLLIIINQLRDLIAKLQDDEASDKAGTELSEANVTLLEEARKQLKKVGIDNDL